MLNNQEYITTELRKILYNILSISSNKLKNLVYIVVGILLSKSVVLSEISEKLKDDYTEASEASKIKRIFRFLTSSIIKSDYLFQKIINMLSTGYKQVSVDNLIRINFILVSKPTIFLCSLNIMMMLT